ncbi:uncharacterized protein LOC131315677 isoform X1 [Rhododendron vialii]|uniref:uncharacterized protein LOC131315677 isoform X1 n=1 Tax=Rhododendron vialii TaxID=182163 RepID=UPI00265E7C84|nr:uncharacterized protein LOC131315677 isoform X1 [Rhododendron vialii]
MDDVLKRLYAITGDSKHLLLAHLFDKPCSLGLPAIKADDVSYFHANTHIPIVIGSQMHYEVTGDSLYKVNIYNFFALLFYTCMKNKGCLLRRCFLQVNRFYTFLLFVHCLPLMVKPVFTFVETFSFFSSFFFVSPGSG